MTHALSLPFAGCVFLGASLRAVAVNAAEVKVFSSPAASGALTEVVPQFERATGHKVLLDFANIAATRKRIAAGETFDIAIISPKAIEELLQQGTIAAGTQYNIGRTGLGVVTRKGAAKPDIGSVDAFKRPVVGAKSVGYAGAIVMRVGFRRTPVPIRISFRHEPVHCTTELPNRYQHRIEVRAHEIGIHG